MRLRHKASITAVPLYRSRPGGRDIQPASQPEATKINDFIYLSEGLSNAFLITTPEGRIVVNTGMGFEAPVHKRIRPTILAFRAMRSGFAFAETIAKAFKYIQENVGGAIPPQSSPTPDITFDDRYELELGGVRVELLWTPGGETTDSMVIWLPEHEVCFTGNLFSALFGHFPNLVTVRGDRYREALVFIESLERVLALEPKMLLPGHGVPVVGKESIREELTRLRDAVRFVHDETAKGMRGKIPTLKPSTRDKYAGILDQHILPALGDNYVGAISPQEMFLHYSHIERDEKHGAVECALALVDIVSRGVACRPLVSRGKWKVGCKIWVGVRHY